MTSGFDRLERELLAAERRSATQTGRSPRRRWPRMSVVVPVLAVVIAVAVAAGALITLGSSPRHITPARPQPGPATNPRQILGVLRRPRTAADRAIPSSHGVGAGSYRLIVDGARVATTTPAGQRVFVIPTTHRTTAPVSATRVVVEVADVSAPVSIADIESGRAAFSFSQSSQGMDEALVLVPDGVARVVLKDASSSTPRLTADVHGNVAVFSAPTDIAVSAREMRWYSAAGTRIAIHDYPDPAPRFAVNAHGQTYGSAGAADSPGRVGPGSEPDLISATGRGPHGGQVTGYVRRAQLDADICGDVKRPKQAVACSRRRQGKTRTIPLYARNGTTVVGPFTTGE